MRGEGCGQHARHARARHHESAPAHHRHGVARATPRPCRVPSHPPMRRGWDARFRPAIAPPSQGIRRHSAIPRGCAWLFRHLARSARRNRGSARSTMPGARSLPAFERERGIKQPGARFYPGQTGGSMGGALAQESGVMRQQAQKPRLFASIHTLHQKHGMAQQSGSGGALRSPGAQPGPRPRPNRRDQSRRPACANARAGRSPTAAR